MAGHVPIYIRIVQGQRLWSILEIEYYDDDEDEGIWMINDTTNASTFIGSMTYISEFRDVWNFLYSSHPNHLRGHVSTYIRIAQGQRLWSTLEIEYYDDDEDE
ncbi:hypothetical protein A2U01_0051112 [Trifolium medium]|uniref:Uncharacterized protein n=1 Tax=Trifolium medium TaxID=97028 RepID=A0A392QZY5_9FABA|nr:hypothetical protein [Trifolium medium]